MKVYESIRQVTVALSLIGIGKTSKNQQQNYNFRGIDAVLNALSTPLCDAHLTILPRVLERTVVERETKSGGALFYVTVKVDFDFVHTGDGSRHTVTTYGEAMDTADKATNKAMSAAYKYMALLAFCVPTEPSAETDADFTTHDVAATPPPARATPQRKVAQPPAPKQADASPPAAEFVQPETAEFMPPLPTHSTATAAANKIQASQAKWLRMKLESLFNDDGKGFLSEQGLASLALEDITDAQFASLRAALIAL